MLLGNALWHLVAQSDSMTKFVLFGLLCASVMCWTIVFYKLVLLNLKRKELKRVLSGFKRIRTLEQLVTFSSLHAKTYPGYLLVTQLSSAKEILDSGLQKGHEHQVESLLDEQRFSAIDDMVRVEESYLSILSVTASVSPLIGLFGTVWGLTHSFISISQKQAADIVTIAPGIAEALLTTLAGLMVAIPVLIMYHYLKGHVEKIEFQLQKVSDKVNIIVRMALLEGKDGHEISVVSQETSEGTVAS